MSEHVEHISSAPAQGKLPPTLTRLAFLGLAFLLPVVSWQAMAAAAALAFLFSIFILPQIVEVSADRPSFAASLRNGTAAYALSVLLLILLYHQDRRVIAAVWAMMAVGGGVGTAADEFGGGAKLPWNRQRTWMGFAGFAMAGTLGGWLLGAWVATTARQPTGGLFAVTVATALLGAAMESLPVRLDRSFADALFCGGFMYCTLLFNPWAWAGNLPLLRVRIFLAVGIALSFALAARALRQVDRSGALVGFGLAVAIYLGYGYKSFLVLLSFFVLGSVATRLGYAQKATRGIAQSRAGARSWREAVANTAPAAFFAVVSLLTLHQAAFLAAFVASLAEAAGDTVSSEIGKWLSPRAYLVTTFRAVPAGENGGVSAPGSLAGIAASSAIVAVGFALGMCGKAAAGLALVGAIAGNLLDSFLGATLERHGLITNGVVNFAGTSFAGGLALAAALRLGL